MNLFFCWGKGRGEGEFEPPTKFSKRERGLAGSQALAGGGGGGAGERGVTFFRGLIVFK